MKMIFRFALVILLCLTLSCSTALSKPDKVNTKDVYNFEFYSNHLSKHLYPQIKKFVEPYHKNMSADEAQIVVGGVSTLVTNYIIENQLFITRPPLVQIFELENNKHIAIVLKVQMTFLDKEESFRDLVNTVIIVKQFLLYFGPKKFKKSGVSI